MLGWGDLRTRKQYHVSLHLRTAFLASCVLNDRSQIIILTSRISPWLSDNLLTTTLQSHALMVRPLGPLLHPSAHNMPNLIFLSLLITITV